MALLCMLLKQMEEVMRGYSIEDYLVQGNEVMADRGFKLEPVLEA